MTSRKLAVAAAAAAAAVLASLAPAAHADQNVIGPFGCGVTGTMPGPIAGLVGYALDSNGAIYCFDTARVQRMVQFGNDSTPHPVAGEKYLALDMRPADGRLWAIGTDKVLYFYDPATGNGGAGPSVAGLDLTGGAIGMDFNPTASASPTGDLRVVTSTGKNYVVNVADGTVTPQGTGLNYGGAAATGITGAAYTNNDAYASTATTLYDIDTANDRVATQVPATGALTAFVGFGGLNSTSNAEMDIYTEISDGRYVNTGFIALDAGSAGSGLYRIGLGPVVGAPAIVASLGSFPDNLKIVGLAIALEQH